MWIAARVEGVFGCDAVPVPRLQWQCMHAMGPWAWCKRSTTIACDSPRALQRMSPIPIRKHSALNARGAA
ncbi:hypothetical protein XOC_2036 [Xanthomonas oryzae pv. oryzicola BLS256]|uniref:Uncharacterized protein n=1 Tax=Xanthomonas oryzae pv. oryzicola (strain BLS256) TaxID=383407 RepID=G7TCK6_XANOB|nr:hypothetical protein XOC_2036 [Xanthomonas oryzae pv. oryzicola BLS256]QEO97864.1 hypothetical protein XOCgx_2875 [Xanthomonas oryzae pv. oryzicola]